MNIGHYVFVNEEVETKEMDILTEADENEQNEEPKAGHKSIHSNPDIQKLEEEKQNIKQRYQTEKQVQERLLNEAKRTASAIQSNSVYDSVQTNTNVLNIKKKIIDLDFKYAQDIYRIENNRIQLLRKMANESFDLPEKYKHLNESNIHQAKIYMGNLIQNDEYHIMKDMRDFKKVFGDSDMLYGKDKNGYYVVCIDQDDFNKMYSTLQEEGYLRDEIISTVMPQILNRSTMIQAEK